MQALKPALSTLANRMQMKGFIGMKRQGSFLNERLNDNLSIKPLVDFVSWMNQTKEAQQLLQEMGIEWKQPITQFDNLEVGVPVCILNSEDKDIGNYVGLTGVIVEIDEGDNGAQPMDPLYIVQFDDGRNAGFWSDELKICQELACV